MKAKTYLFMNVLSVLGYITLLSYALENAGTPTTFKEFIIFIPLMIVCAVAFLISFYKLNEMI